MQNGQCQLAMRLAYTQIKYRYIIEYIDTFTEPGESYVFWRRRDQSRPDFRLPCGPLGAAGPPWAAAAVPKLGSKCGSGSDILRHVGAEEPPSAIVVVVVVVDVVDVVVDVVVVDVVASCSNHFHATRARQNRFNRPSIGRPLQGNNLQQLLLLANLHTHTHTHTHTLTHTLTHWDTRTEER